MKSPDRMSDGAQASNARTQRNKAQAIEGGARGDCGA
jgi:hypothetical protein